MMKQLICEMCGSNDLLKQDGVFVCQTCGTKYSVEEAKKMMVEGTVEVKGTVKVDNVDSIENYIKLAQAAYSSKNYPESEQYANKIIEIDPNNYLAWLLKGQSAGWQSTLANPRFAECVSSFSIAIANTPPDNKQDIEEEIKREITNLSCALVSLRGKRFQKWPDEEEANGFISDIATILETVTAFLINGITISLDDIMSPTANMINESVLNAYENTIYPDYENKEYPYPNDQAFYQYVKRIDFCIQLIEKSIKLCKSDNEANIQRYKNLMNFQEHAINACSYDWHYPDVKLDSVTVARYRREGFYVDTYNNRIYFVKLKLTDSSKDFRRSKIAEYETKINAIEAEIDKKIKAEKKKIRDEFWSKHIEEHKALTEELRKTKQRRDELVKENKGYSKTHLLDTHISEINAILEEDRKPTSKLKKSEKEFIDNCPLFWNNLSSNDEYDEYLDQYPILKKAKEYTNKQIDLINQKRTIDERKNDYKKGMLFKSICTISIVFAVAGMVIATIIDEDLFFLGFIMFMIGALVAVFTGVQASLYSEFTSAQGVEKTKTLKRKYQSELKSYNKTIDEMNAIPKFTGKVDSDKIIRIPPKISIDEYN